MTKESLPIGVRSLYAKTYAKHGKTIGQSKDAMDKAYEAVEKKHGKEMLGKLYNQLNIARNTIIN